VTVKVDLPGNLNYKDGEGVITVTVTATDPYLRRHTMRHGEKAVDISLHTNTGSLEVSGDEDAASPVLIATYDADGRFLGLLIVTGDSAIDSAAEEGELLKIFWTDVAGTPLDEAYSGEE
nr:hypothetical protein [Clostridia bacterium]